MASTNQFSENVAAWVAVGWVYEITEAAGVWTARVYSGVTVPYTVTGGSMLIAATILANTLPIAVTPLPP